jgi:hypothetical protein
VWQLHCYNNSNIVVMANDIPKCSCGAEVMYDTYEHPTEESIRVDYADCFDCAHSEENELPI